MAMHTISVPEESDGVRLDRFLASVLADLSRSHIQKLIKDGHIQVAGRAAKSNQAVKTGQAISLDVPEAVDATPVAEALPLPIL